MKRTGVICVGIAAISLGLSPHASTQTNAGYFIPTETIDSAGANTQSAHYALYGSAAGEFGVASTASVTSATYVAKAGYVGQLSDAIVPTNVVSRKIHGTGAPQDPRLDIPLPLNLLANSMPGIECRAAGHTEAGVGIDHQLVFTFPIAVTFGNATSSPPGLVDSFSGNNTTTVKVNLKSVTNAQKITVTLLGVNDGQATNDVSVQMGVLAGDTTGDGTVNSSDVSQTKARSGQTVGASNFRSDVTVDGVLNSSDVSSVKSKSGTALP